MTHVFWSNHYAHWNPASQELAVHCLLIEVDIKTFDFPLFPIPNFVFSLSSSLYLDPWGIFFFSIFFSSPWHEVKSDRVAWWAPAKVNPPEAFTGGRDLPHESLQALDWWLLPVLHLPQLLSLKITSKEETFLCLYSQRKKQRDFLLVSVKNYSSEYHLIRSLCSCLIHMLHREHYWANIGEMCNQSMLFRRPQVFILPWTMPH